MEKHIGTWTIEGHDKDNEVGELSIDGNHVEFYSRYRKFVFPGETFVGGDGQHIYKVFVNGGATPSENKILSDAKSYNVLYVLMQNEPFPKGNDIVGIKEISFVIPELVEWFGIPFVSLECNDQGELAAFEINMDEILLCDSNPKMKIYFESKTINCSESLLSYTTRIVKKEPRISISYDESVKIKDALEDIECVMQFFGLLIGRVSTVEDIRLTIENQQSKSWLFINRDLSYNCKMWDFDSKPRTYYYLVEDDLVELFDNWRNFFFDNQFSLLRRIYFSVNNSKEKFAEDIFVEYMRILDGYHTRITGDEETQRKLRQALKNAKKDIKKQLFKEENKPIFEQSIKTVLEDWKFNSDNVGDIADWIASGYLGRKSLSYRLKELDSDYGILKENAVMILERKEKIIEEDKIKAIELYYKQLADTRNYYSHYKDNTDGVLDFYQIVDSIVVLKATIISIFYKHMKMDRDLIRRILAFDRELNMLTSFLRREGESGSFLTPGECIKELKSKRTIESTAEEE